MNPQNAAFETATYAVLLLVHYKLVGPERFELSNDAGFKPTAYSVLLRAHIIHLMIIISCAGITLRRLFDYRLKIQQAFKIFQIQAIKNPLVKVGCLISIERYHPPEVSLPPKSLIINFPIQR